MTIFKKNKITTIIICITAFFSSCSMLVDMGGFTDANDDYGKAVELTMGNEGELIINWDTENDPFKDASGTYLLYYREHLSEGWTLLMEIEDTESDFEIDLSVFSEGSYDFGISFMDDSGNESDFHTSIDQDADPNGGWYLTIEE